MRAVQCQSFGPPEALKVVELDDPMPGPGEVVIDVKAASMNFPDFLIIQGKYQVKPPLPFTPGGEGAGVVSAVGDKVQNLRVGDRVLFNGQMGAFASKVTLAEMFAMKIPDDLDFEAAAALTITYGTTIHAYRQRALLQAGETVLVLGAAGGVGLAAIELAKADGARVIAAASTDDKLAVCREAGADAVINYSETELKPALKELAPKGVDVVYDPVGGDFSEAALRAMAPGGRFLVIGFASGDIPKIPLNLCLLKQCAIVGVFWGGWLQSGHFADHLVNMQALFDMAQSGAIKPRISHRFGLDDIVEAYATVTGRKVKGKLIITP